MDRQSNDASPAIQDHYLGEFAHCFGCGPRNPQGHHLKSRVTGEDETEARFRPDPKYTGGFPEYAYGGILASLLDCHGTATAAGCARRRAQAKDAAASMPRFVTASLKVEFKRPTPLDDEWLITGKLRSLEGRKAWVDLSLVSRGEVCVTGEMLAIQITPP